MGAGRGSVVSSLAGPQGKLRTVTDPGLFKECAHVGLYRALGHLELLCDFAVAQPQPDKLDEGALIEGATIVGGAKLVEFLSDGTPCISY